MVFSQFNFSICFFRKSGVHFRKSEKRMKLKAYIQSERGKATALAEALNIPATYLSQMASGNRAITAERASDIERFTGGVVTRKDMFPDKWARIWPELSKGKVKPFDGITERRVGPADRRSAKAVA